MIIDFHTHIFPEPLAARTLPWLHEICGLPYWTDGTAKGLRASMDRCGVDLCVTLPIVTRPGTMRKINDYAAAQAREWGFVSFGSVHPEEPDWRGELRRFRELGLKGVKLHHDYQNFRFDSRENYAIIEAAFGEDLPVLVHPGIDAVSPSVHRCSTKMLREAMPLLRQGTFIAAHMGAHMALEDAARDVIGQDIYIDVSMARLFYPPEALRPLLLDHDPDRILFATDSPWDDQAQAIAALHALELGDTLEKKILGDNARRVLNI